MQHFSHAFLLGPLSLDIISILDNSVPYNLQIMHAEKLYIDLTLMKCLTLIIL